MSRIGYQPGFSTRNNVISFLEDHFEQYPDRVALRWVKRGAVDAWEKHHSSALPTEQILYRDLTRGIRRTAQGLLNIGIKKGDRVILFLPMGLEMYTAMFAIQRIGAIAVFLDSWARANHLGASAECVDPVAMISFDAAFRLIEPVPEFRSMKLRISMGPCATSTHRLEDLMATQSEAPIEPVESETTALITFTTGSSGTPKGANRTHRFLAAQHEALARVVPYTDRDEDMPAFPIFSLNNLASGVTTVLPGLNLAAPAPHDSAILVTQIMQDKLSCATLSPSMLLGLSKYCIEHQVQLTSLRRVVTGGAPISKDNVADFYKVAPQSQLWVLYGSTEVEPMAHIEGRDMLAQEAPSDPEIIEEGVNVGHVDESVGYKFIKIRRGPVDLAKEPWSTIELPAGHIGEFLVSGDHVCKDYYNNPDAFIKAKIKETSGRVWHRTGDLAYLDAQKNLWMVGRIHNVIERSGEYLFPVRPEVLLARQPQIARAAYLGMPDPRLGERTAVVVQAKSGFTLEGDELPRLLSEIKRVFVKNKIPMDSFYVVSEIPMDPRHHSKVEYAVLRDFLIKNSVKDLLT